MKKSRTQYSAYNSLAAGVSQFISLVMSFISRTIFIKVLGEQYLGLNGLFTNILSIVSFAELGIGAAITYSLYEPIARKDNEQILALMQLYRKYYHLIALVIFILGLSVTPFLPYLINGSIENIGNIYIAFLLFLMNSVMSYLWNYKRSIFFANQKGYINSLNTLVFQIGAQVLQIIFLLIHPSYFTYLIIQVLLTIMSNLQISYLADKMYPFLKRKDKVKVSEDVILYIRRNIIGMVSGKVGGIVVNGTDNILLSAFLGLSSVGIYSNYTLVLNGVTSIINQGVSAVTSSIGNMHVLENQRKQQRIFYQYAHINGIVSIFISAGLISFFSPFINVWLGKGYILSDRTTWLIVVGFFITQLRQSNINFTNAYGLYWEQRIKPIYESLVNFTVSILLISVFSMGIESVIIGTLVSNLLVNAWWEPLIVLRSGIKSSFYKYVKFYLSQLSIGIFLLTVIQLIVSKIPNDNLIQHIFLSTIFTVGSGLIFDDLISFCTPLNKSEVRFTSVLRRMWSDKLRK